MFTLVILLFSKYLDEPLDNKMLIVYTSRVMDSQERSILQQKAHDTYERNEYIRMLHRQGKSLASIGRQFRMSRQAVFKIVAKAGNNSKEAQLL